MYKAQEDVDPLGTVPKKDGKSDKDGSVKSARKAESSTASVSSNIEEDGKFDSIHQEGTADDG